MTMITKTLYVQSNGTIVYVQDNFQTTTHKSITTPSSIYDNK